MDELTLAACGLDCAAYDLYNAAKDPKAAEALVGWFRHRGWIGMDEGAEAIQRKAPFCKGCRNRDFTPWCGNCGLRVCCEKRGLAYCGECAGFPCEAYREWTVGMEHHQRAMERLLKMKTESENF